MTWKLLRPPRPVVKIELADRRTVEGTAFEVNAMTRQISVRMPGNKVVVFGLQTGRISATVHGAHLERPRIKPESLDVLRRHIESRGETPADGEAPAERPSAAVPTRAASVCIVANDDVGSLVVAGGDHVVHLLAPAGYSASELAAKLEAIVASAEHAARQGMTMKVVGRQAGRASATQRKTKRTHRRSRDD